MAQTLMARFELTLESLEKLSKLQIKDNFRVNLFILKMVYCLYLLESPY